MQVRTYRARSLKDALQMVQQDLGPDAKVVQTRELRTGWWDRVSRGRQFEIRMRRPGPKPLPLRRHGQMPPADVAPKSTPGTPASLEELRQQIHDSATEPPAVVGSGVDSALIPPRVITPAADVNPVWFELLAEMIDAEIPESAAREWIESLRQRHLGEPLDLATLRDALVQTLDQALPVGGPIHCPVGGRRTVTLVGPTGVGKTTTIAKLAANFRLREQRRVGLITVDTYRVAAVEQLRTYAEIMDLPMEVVSTPREMAGAVARLAEQDLLLIDTAGHSPRDAVQLQQLKSLLQEAHADETHLVLSCVSATPHLRQILHNFRPLGVTSLVLTKLDEASGLGNLVPVLRASDLPISYLTCGQSVPDDIVVADKQKLVLALLGQQPIASLI